MTVVGNESASQKRSDGGKHLYKGAMCATNKLAAPWMEYSQEVGACHRNSRIVNWLAIVTIDIMGIGDLHIARKQTNNQYCKRTETKAVCDDFFKILHPTRLPIASKKHIGKVVKGPGWQGS